MRAYPELERRFERMLTLRSVEDMLHWDAAAMMPDGAMPSRAHQLATLKVMQHEMLCAPELAELLDEAEAHEQSQLDAWQAANLREMRRMWIHAASVPAKLVDAFSRASSACDASWRDARPASDFQAVRPALEEVVRLARELGAARAERLGTSAYEALLDEHEPGMRCHHIDPLFDDLAAFLPPFRAEVMEEQARRGEPLPLRGPFDVEAQRRLGLQMMRAVGFELDHGRLDVSLHPFCGGTPDDVRITTRYDEDDFAESLMGVLHETGHALYQRGLPEAWRYQPVGQPRGMAMHESQSLLIEMQACRGRGFLAYAAPHIRQAFGGQGEAWSVDNLVQRYKWVAPDYIRVNADEVCYPSHVILRYRLEKALIGGDLQVAELPGAWNDGMMELLGLDVPDDRRGCLQDAHWYDGAWGYFPSYTLGAIIAAQLFRRARRDATDIDAAIEQGDFTPLVGWLRQHVHGLGSLYTTPELIERATGEPLDITHYKSHLRSRYLPE